MKDSPAKRDVNIEVFRAMCAFGVCFLHALDQGGYAGQHRGLDNLMPPSVVGFVFISGFFSIKFSWQKVVRILGIGVGCLLLVVLGFDICYRGNFSVIELVNRGVCYAEDFWFLWMYLGLMMVAPLLNGAVNVQEESSASPLRQCVPILFCVFIWSYCACCIPYVKKYIPSAIGMGSCSVLTFAAVYLVARMCSCYKVEDKIGLKGWLTMLVVSGCFCWLGFKHYNSPFAMIFAGSMFYLVKSIKVPIPVSKVASFIGPSMFGVCLLHANRAGLEFLIKMENCMIDRWQWNYYISCFIVAIIFFLGGVALDLIRRCFVYIVFRRYK